MGVTNYHSVNGRLLGETRPTGERIHYLTDAIGSVIATMNDEGVVLNTYRYKPFGGILYADETDPTPRFLWAGTTGSRHAGLQYAEHYNLARHYGSRQGQWTTVDPLWPMERPYAYVNANPTTWVDPLGFSCCCCALSLRLNLGSISRISGFTPDDSQPRYGHSFQVDFAVVYTQEIGPGEGIRDCTLEWREMSPGGLLGTAPSTWTQDLIAHPPLNVLSGQFSQWKDRMKSCPGASEGFLFDRPSVRKSRIDPLGPKQGRGLYIQFKLRSASGCRLCNPFGTPIVCGDHVVRVTQFIGKGASGELLIVLEPPDKSPLPPPEPTWPD